MGKYIETDVVLGKAEWIKKHLGAMSLTGKPNHVGTGYVPVCVVDNGHFEAAAIAYNSAEAESFNDKTDKRKKEWLLIKVQDAVRLCPSVAQLIDWRA